MKAGRFFFMMAVAALVTGAAFIVYAYRGGEMPKLAQSPVQASAAEPAPESGTPAAKPEPAASQTEKPQTSTPIPAQYDLTVLPDPVKRMLESMVEAAQSGDIETMRPVLESNELKPMVSAGAVDDPIAYWKRVSTDGEGREILAAMLDVLSSGYVRVGEGREEMFVWPYFAEADLRQLAPAQEVDLYRMMPPRAAATMKRSGRYDYFRIGIAPDGVWHYFLQ
jgi:hypothetical protein